MILVGICGQIGSGKSTLAELLTTIDPQHSIHLETSTIVRELANTFNQSLHNQRGLLEDQDNYVTVANSAINTLIQQLSAMAGRAIDVQSVIIDTDDVVIHPDWYEKLFIYLRQAAQMPNITDEEITSENKSNYRPLLQWIGGYFLYKLENPVLWYEELLRRAHANPETNFAALTALRQPLEAEFVQQAGGKVIEIIRHNHVTDTTDVTERLVADIVPDAVINNDSSLEKLAKIAQKVHQDLLNDRLQPKY